MSEASPAKKPSETQSSESKIKALLMIDWAPEKGCSLADRLRENEIDCDVIGTDFPLAKWTPLRKFFSHWSRCLFVGYQAFRRRKDYDYVIAWQQIMGFAFGFLKLITFTKKPRLFILTTNITERENPALAWLRKMAAKLAWAGADEVGFYSEKHKELISQDFGLPRTKAVHLPYAINVQNLKSSETNALDSYIFSIGISYRDWATLLTAAKVTDKPFVLVTQDFTLRGLEIPENVKIYRNTFGGKAKELMRNASVVVTPLQFTHSPAGEATLLEGMALEKPSIITQTVTTEEYVRDKIDGLLVPCRDAKALAEAIAYIYADPERAKRMAREGRQRVLDTYSMEAFAARVAKIMRKRIED